MFSLLSFNYCIIKGWNCCAALIYKSITQVNYFNYLRSNYFAAVDWLMLHTIRVQCLSTFLFSFLITLLDSRRIFALFDLHLCAFTSNKVRFIFAIIYQRHFLMSNFHHNTRYCVFNTLVYIVTNYNTLHIFLNKMTITLINIQGNENS